VGWWWMTQPLFKSSKPPICSNGVEIVFSKCWCKHFVRFPCHLSNFHTNLMHTLFHVSHFTMQWSLWKHIQNFILLRNYMKHQLPSASQDSSVTIMTRVWAGWPEFNTWQGQGIFSLCHHVQTGSEVHSASDPGSTRGNVAMTWSWQLTSI
jgi:hypothetical protein